MRSAQSCSSTLRFATAIAPAERSDGVDRRVGKDAGGQNGERTAAGAKIEDAEDRFGVAGERVVLGKRGHQEFADETARHDDALVDIERHALDVGAMQE